MRIPVNRIFLLSILLSILIASTTLAAPPKPNLLPYQPSGWSDKIVVSNTTGTTTDNSPLYSTDTLYIDWAIANISTADITATFYIDFYLDNNFIGRVSRAGLNRNTYLYSLDTSIGSLSSGTHTIKMVIDPTNAVDESNETDNEYTKTINVVSLPNLAPYQPAGWDDKIVVSSSTGTNTDSGPPYFATDSLYLDWAVINNGAISTASSFTTKLYLDTVEIASWSVPSPLNGGSYTSISDYALGSLSVGTHNLKIVADTSNTISESNETDNEYTKTIVITSADAPNLKPYKPAGWSDKIVLSNTTGTNTDTALYTTDNVYLDWAVINNGTQPTAASFTTKLYVDGVEINSWTTPAPLNNGNYTFISDYSLGTLSVGVHAIKIVTDTGGTISEVDESDNEYVREITILKSGAEVKRALVLMVDFSDKVGQESRDYFQDMLFSHLPSVAPLGSFLDYYLEVSYGQIEVIGSVNNVDIAWIRLPQTLAYYADNNYGTDGPYPTNAQKMVEDAVVAAAALGLDFGPYDENNDGFVDSLFVIHAGRGAEFTGSRGDIWSHAWVTHSPVNTGSTNGLGNAVYVYPYSTEPEYWASLHDMTMGVYAHEYGHILGLPDLYDTDYSSEGVGVWSIMAGGSWNGTNGNSPAHMDAWSKNVLGWVTATKVTGTLTNEPIDQVETNQDIYQLLSGVPDVSGEYFLVENRQKTGFDSALPASGLLIWHIDEAKSGNDTECYPGGPSCSTGHYKVALVQADNLWQLEKNINSGDGGDPYPGSTTNTTFNASSSPNSNLYSGAASNASVTSISNSGSTMTATLTGPSPGTIQLSSSTYSVAENGGTVTITATRTSGSSGAVGISYATSNGTAIAGSDYTSTSGTLSWTNGDTANKTFTVSITNDTLDEPDETFNVTLSSPTGGASLGNPSSATVTITDDDPTPTIQFQSSSSSGSEATTPAVITVTLSAASGQTVTVNYATANGTATAGSDYTSTSGTLTFNSGDTSKTISVPIIDDTDVEGNETFTVTLSSPSNASLGATTTHTYTINDNDSYGTIQLSSSTYSVAENGGTVTITATRTSGSSGAVGISYATSNGTAIAGSDYTSTSGTLSWTNGDTANKTFTVSITNDTLNEPDETFNVTLSSPTGGASLGSPSSATVTITDDDPAPTVQFQSASSNGSEATTPAVITVTLSAASGKTVTVNYATANGTATAGSDYTATSGTLTFNSGDTSKTISVPIIDDTDVEGNETFTVTISSPSNASLGATITHTYTINDNDVTISASADPNGSIVPSGSVTVTIGSTQTFTVNPNSGYHTDSITGTCPSGTWNGIDYSTGTITASCTLTANFAENLVEIVSNWYTGIQDAYNSASSSDSIKLRGSSFSENLNFNRDISIVLQGGYNADFSSVTGATTIAGSVTVSGGTVTVSSIILR